MEKIFFCGECRKFYFEDCDESVYSCACKSCGSDNTITCNLDKDTYNSYDEDTKNTFKRNMKRKYGDLDAVIMAKNRIIAQREYDAKLLKINSIKVTTGDLKQDYEIIGPVYYQINNRGLLTTEIDRKAAEYSAEIAAMKASELMSQERADWGFLYGNYSVGENQFEKAFFIATQELKKRAYMLGADAVICMRQDIDLETEHLNNFYLQMYGTAVKLI